MSLCSPFLCSNQHLLTGRQQQGLTLIEMLVTALLGALVLVSVATAISAITKTQSTIDRYEKVQESKRFTSALLDRSLRTATEINNAQNEEFTIKREPSGRTDPETGEETPTYSCIGTLHTKADGSWQERFYFKNGRLYCELPAAEQREVITYDIEDLSWQYAVYSTNKEVKWQASDALNLSTQKITAVKVNLKFKGSSEGHTHAWVLRKALANYINKESGTSGEEE